MIFLVTKKLLGCEGKNMTKSMFKILLQVANRDNYFKEDYKVKKGKDRTVCTLLPFSMTWRGDIY